MYLKEVAHACRLIWEFEYGIDHHGYFVQSRNKGENTRQ